ncbi:MAG: N-glycosylase/DNA lyase [Nanoarchaeota archaeon]|nr:N-glycosylase/DNA lyase [Nanoarchaeota archaeon]
MRKLIADIENLKRTDIKKVIDSRIKDFKQLNAPEDIFKELCFCLLTANYSAEGGIRVQKAIGDGFITLSEKRLAQRLKTLGYRFPNVRTGFIIEARKHKMLKQRLHSFSDENKARDWLVDNIKGLGFKEASHFLRNIGYGNLAIIDFHIVDLLEKHKLIERPKTITKNKYLEIEKILQKVAKKSNLNLAELDLYMWFKETGKVLK